MSSLRFFSRVAFICNLCFLGALIVLRIDHPPDGELISLMIVIGFVLAVVINVIVNLCYGIALLRRKPLRNFIPLWLIIANFLFLIPQLILLLR